MLLPVPPSCVSGTSSDAAVGPQVEWQSKKLRDNSVVVLKANLQHLFTEDAGPEAYAECVKEYADSVPAEEIIKVIWTSMVASVNTVGKNQMQLLQMILKSIKQNKALLETYTSSLKLELALLNCLQVTCYEDSKLLKVRPEWIVISLFSMAYTHGSCRAFACVLCSA
jgi:hypothetical protein